MGARAQVTASESAAGSPPWGQERAVRLHRADIKLLAPSRPTRRAWGTRPSPGCCGRGCSTRGCWGGGVFCWMEEKGLESVVASWAWRAPEVQL